MSFREMRANISRVRAACSAPLIATGVVVLLATNALLILDRVSYRHLHLPEEGWLLDSAESAAMEQPATDELPQHKCEQLSNPAFRLPLVTQVQALPPTGSAPSEEFRELQRARDHIFNLEAQIEKMRPCNVKTSAQRWYDSVSAERAPPIESFLYLAQLVEAYEGVELLPHEGFWILEREELDDWTQFAPTVDEAIILHLGEERIRREVTAQAFRVLYEDFSPLGYFK